MSRYGKLILVNDDDLTYCSLRLDSGSLDTAFGRIADIAEPLPRTLVWSAAWEMTRDAELRARDLCRWCPAAFRPRPRSASRSGCYCRHRPRWAPTPIPGGPVRKAGRRSPTGCWNWPAARDRLRPSAGVRQRAVHIGVVAAACDGAERPARWRPCRVGLAGLTVDTDLRWRIVTALAAAGEIDADGPPTPFIDAEVQRDPTAAGKRLRRAGRRRPAAGGASRKRRGQT